MGNAIFMGGNTSQQGAQIGSIIYAKKSPGEDYIDLYEKGSYGNNYIPIEPEYDKLLKVSSNYYPSGYEIKELKFETKINDPDYNLFCFLPENNYTSYLICGNKLMYQNEKNDWEQYEYDSTILPTDNSSLVYGYIRKHDDSTNNFKTIGITLSSTSNINEDHRLIIHDNNRTKIKTYNILINDSIKSYYSLQGIYMFKDWAVAFASRRNAGSTAYISIFKGQDFQDLQDKLTNIDEKIEIKLPSYPLTFSFVPTSSYSKVNALKCLRQNENDDFHFILYYRSNTGRGATTDNYFYYTNINIDSAKENISYTRHSNIQSSWIFKTLNDWESANKLSVYMFKGGSYNNSTIKIIDITLSATEPVGREKTFDRNINQNPNSQINLQTGQIFQFLHNGLYYNFRANNINLPQEFFNITKINKLTWENENIQNISSLSQDLAIILENINDYEEIYKILKSSYKVGYLNKTIYIASPQFKKCYPQIPMSLSLGDGYRPYIKVR